MLILGLLLVIVALVVFGYLFFGTSDLEPLQIDLGVFTVELTPLHLFLLGAGTLVVLVLGLLFVTMGLRASRRRQREVKELRKAVDERPARPAEYADRDRAPRDREVPPAPTRPSHDRATDAEHTTGAPAGSGTGAPDRSSMDRSSMDRSSFDNSSIDLPSDHRDDSPSSGTHRD